MSFVNWKRKWLTIESGSLLVITVACRRASKQRKLTALVQAALQRASAALSDSSGEALKAALEPGQLELVKPNQKELSALVNRELSQPDDVRTAAQELVRTGKAHRVVVLSVPQGALAVDKTGFVQVVPPPMKSQSTVGAG